MADYMHEIVKELTGMSARNKPWDYRVFWPSLNDESIVTVSIKWKEDEDWQDHRFLIELHPLMVEI